MELTFPAFESATQGMPADAFAQAVATLSIGVQPLNGEDIAAVFPPYLTNATAMEQQMLTQFHIIVSHFPRLKWLSSGMRRQPSIAAIQHVLAQQEVEHHSATFEFMENIRNGNTVNQHINAAFGLGERLQRQTGLLTRNLSQYHRNLQVDFLRKSGDLLDQAYRAMQQFCLKNDYEFQLRNILAFPGPRSSALEKLPVTAGIHPPEYYMSPMQQSVWNLLGEDKRGLTGLELKWEYQWWYDRTATAVIKSKHDNSGLYLMPALTPPVLFDRRVESIPIFCRKFDSFLAFDQAILVDYWKPGDDHTFELYDPGFLLILHHAAQVMNLIATLTSLVAASVNLGRGHHKISWIESPLNGDLISFLQSYGTDLIQHLRGVI